MITEERYSIILNLLKEKKTVTVTELALLLSTSESTIRRDLNALDEAGKLSKVHGGATLKKANPLLNKEEDVKTKSMKNAEEKEAIGKYGASLINDNDFVYIDAGTTTERLIKYIPESSKATFVTNGIAHAKMLIYKGLRAYIIGGELKLTTEAVIGLNAVTELGKYNFTKCFLGTNGIDKKSGFTTPDISEAILKSKAYEKSFVTYILADHSKFNRICAVSFGDLSKSCIITDKLTDETLRECTIIKEVLL